MEKSILQWALWCLFGAIMLTALPGKARVPFLVVIILGALVYMEKKEKGASMKFFRKVLSGESV